MNEKMIARYTVWENFMNQDILRIDTIWLGRSERDIWEMSNSET